MTSIIGEKLKIYPNNTEGKLSEKNTPYET